MANLKAFFEKACREDMEYAGYIAKHHLISLLGEGIDATRLARMLSVWDVWEEYELLRSYGANPGTLKRAVSRFFSDCVAKWEVPFVKKNMGLFFERGISLDRMMKFCYSKRKYSVRRNGYVYVWQYPTRDELKMNGLDDATIDQNAEKYHIVG